MKTQSLLRPLWSRRTDVRERDEDPPKLSGSNEVVEASIGSNEHNKHSKKKHLSGRGTVGKRPAIGMRERGGRTIAKPVEGTGSADLHAEIEQHVERRSTIYEGNVKVHTLARLNALVDRCCTTRITYEELTSP